MKLNIEGIVYLIGIAVFGLSYHWLKPQFSGEVFVAGAIAYFIALRIVGLYLEKKFGPRAADRDSDA